MKKNHIIHIYQIKKIFICKQLIMDLSDNVTAVMIIVKSTNCVVLTINHIFLSSLTTSQFSFTAPVDTKYLNTSKKYNWEFKSFLLMWKKPYQ